MIPRDGDDGVAGVGFVRNLRPPHGQASVSDGGAIPPLSTTTSIGLVAQQKGNAMRTKANKLSDDQIADLILFSGADDWGWWQDIDGSEIDGFTIVGDNPEVEDSPIEVTIGVQFIRNVIDRVLGNQLDGWGIIEEAIDNDDWDANTADIVLQYAVYGEIVYG